MKNGREERNKEWSQKKRNKERKWYNIEYSKIMTDTWKGQKERKKTEKWVQNKTIDKKRHKILCPSGT
jgi:hypothetical protein